MVQSTKPRLIIGCPIRRREWVLPEWFSFILSAIEVANVDASFVFLLSPRDEGVIGVLDSIDLPITKLFVEEEDSPDERVWNEDRYHHMVALRNTVLTEVRHQAPDYFFSLDSDILVHPNCLTNMLESASQFDAVGGLTYMSTFGTWCPSYAYLRQNQGLDRSNFDDVRIMDVIMGLKLMNPAAYAVDYRYHDQGEDIGWSIACREKHLKLGIDARVANKHVMERSMLTTIDERCGF